MLPRRCGGVLERCDRRSAGRGCRLHPRRDAMPRATILRLARQRPTTEQRVNNLLFATAQELAEGIRRRRISSTEVVEAHLAQIDRYNPALNAIVTLDRSAALDRAREADAAVARGEIWGPLHGVPLTVNDALETAGLRSATGLSATGRQGQGADATAVARLRAAGAVLLAKTNRLPAMGDVQADTLVVGRSNNPWDLQRSPGGSSGGGAAAVAAGLSPLDLGCDDAGSLRIPAHWCGIYALKATDTRVPHTGHIPELPGMARGMRHMPQVGPLARSVQDLALALRLICGPDGRQWDVPPVPLDAAPERSLRQLRLAWTDEFAGVPVSADTRGGLSSLVNDLRRLGTAIEPWHGEGFDFVEAWETWGELSQAEQGSGLAPEEEAALQRFGADLDSVVPMSRGIARGMNASMRQFTDILHRRARAIERIEALFERCDALLCPVSVGPALRHTSAGSAVQVDRKSVPYWLAAMAYTTPFSLTGHPSVVLPLGRSAEGLPIGVQVVGRRWAETALLGMAASLDVLLGSFQRPVGYYGRGVA